MEIDLQGKIPPIDGIEFIRAMPQDENYVPIFPIYYSIEGSEELHSARYNLATMQIIDDLVGIDSLSREEKTEKFGNIGWEIAKIIVEAFASTPKEKLPKVNLEPRW